MGSSRYDIGLHGFPLQSKNKSGMKRDFAILEPFAVKGEKTVAKKVGNEFLLGEEVVQLMNEEISTNLARGERWYNRLGLIRMDDGLITVRPREEICSENVEMIDDSDTYAVSFDYCEPLIGTGGGTIQDPLNYIHTDHPILQIATDFDIGGAAIREDYTCSLFWRCDDYDEGIVFGGCRKTPLTIDVVISPYCKEAALALNDGRLVLLDKEAKPIIIIKDVHCDCLTFGTSNDVIIATSEKNLLFIDCRAGGKIGQEFPIGSPSHTITGCNYKNYFAVASIESLDIFDLRMISSPIAEYDWKFPGCCHVPWLNWVDQNCNDLILYDIGKPYGSLILIQDALEGNPSICKVKLEQSGIGFASEAGRISLLTDDLTIYSLKYNEIPEIQRIGKLEINTEDIKSSVDAENKDNFLSSIYDTHMDPSACGWDPTNLPIAPQLPTKLPPICNQLLKHWTIE